MFIHNQAIEVDDQNSQMNQVDHIPIVNQMTILSWTNANTNIFPWIYKITCAIETSTVLFQNCSNLNPLKVIQCGSAKHITIDYPLTCIP